MSNEPLFMTIAETARLIKISESQVRVEIAYGRIPTVEFGRRKLVPYWFLRALATPMAQPSEASFQ